MSKKSIYFFSALIIFFCIFNFSIKKSWADAFQPAPIPTPTILSTSQIDEINGNQIEVSGISMTGEIVLIYLNGSFNGYANISQIDSNLSKFSFLSSLATSTQSNEVSAIAQDKNFKILSAPANATVKTEIEQSALLSNSVTEKIIPIESETLTPPSLLSPSGNSCLSSLHVSGYASGSVALVYVDNHLLTTLPLTPKPSGTSFFAYSPMITISRGYHSVFVIAKDNARGISAKSAVIKFCMSTPLISASSTPDEGNITSDNSSAAISTTSADLVFQKTNSTNGHLGIPKNFLNILIFIIFILGLLIWMIFVNRELRADLPKSDYDLPKETP